MEIEKNIKGGLMVRHSFKDCFQLLKDIHEYDELVDGEIVSFILDRHAKLEFILNKYSWLKPLVTKIGYEDSFKLFEQEKYHLTNIKRKAINYQDTSINQIVADQLSTYKEVNIGTFISAAKAKEIIKEIYSSMNIEKTPKGSDLNTYFVCKDRAKRSKNKVVNGFIVMQSKY